MTIKVALVTGSAKRLGKDMALFLSENGFTVIFHYYKSKNEIEKIAKKFNKNKKPFYFYKADISDKKQVKKMADHIKKKFGRLDLLINNVGNYIVKDINNLSVDEWDETIQTNLSGAFYCIYYLKPLITKAKGNIINIGYANAANIEGRTDATAYAISKTGLLMLTKNLAKSLGPKKIRTNMISPGQLEYSIDLPKNVQKKVPLGKPGKSSDICAALLFILQNHYVNGAHLEITGGYTH